MRDVAGKDRKRETSHNRREGKGKETKRGHLTACEKMSLDLKVTLHHLYAGCAIHADQDRSDV